MLYLQVYSIFILVSVFFKNYFSRAADSELVKCALQQRILAPMCQRSVLESPCTSPSVAHGGPIASEWQNCGGHSGVAQWHSPVSF